MRSGVTFARVRFDLGDPDGNRHLGIGALEYAAEKGRGDFKYVASKETTFREIQPVKVTHRAIVRARQWVASSNKQHDARWQARERTSASAGVERINCKVEIEDWSKARGVRRNRW